jgi:hypothetical protein
MQAATAARLTRIPPLRFYINGVESIALVRGAMRMFRSPLPTSPRIASLLRCLEHCLPPLPHCSLDGPDRSESREQRIAEPAHNPPGRIQEVVLEADDGAHDHASLSALAAPVENGARQSFRMAAKRIITAYEGLARALTQLRAYSEGRFDSFTA